MLWRTQNTQYTEFHVSLPYNYQHRVLADSRLIPLTGQLWCRVRHGPQHVPALVHVVI